MASPPKSTLHDSVNKFTNKTPEEHRSDFEATVDSNPNVMVSYDKFVLLASELKLDMVALTYAIHMASIKHKGITRKDVAKTPYIIHCIGVCLILIDEGKICDANLENQAEILIASILHDTLEDTATTPEEITETFDGKVASLVKEVTNPKGLNSEESKAWQLAHADSMSKGAKLIKLADRLYNIRDMNPPPAAWSKEKSDAYVVHSQKLLVKLAGVNGYLEAKLKTELDRLSA